MWLFLEGREIGTAVSGSACVGMDRFSVVFIKCCGGYIYVYLLGVGLLRVLSFLLLLLLLFLRYSAVRYDMVLFHEGGRAGGNVRVFLVGLALLDGWMRDETREGGIGSLYFVLFFRG